MPKTILVTGASGFIGSHTCVELLQSGFDIVALDNLCNSSREALERVRKITGRDFPFVEADIRDRAALDAILAQHRIDAVIHFAGLKAVGESVEKPLEYFENNVSGSVTLLQALRAVNVKTFVFSSSATVYGDPEVLPLVESARLSVTNPYGRTKLMVEQILNDLERSDASWRIGILRYFNPVGAHESGLIGEDPRGIPNNLMPFIAQVAVGRREKLSVFGNDYPTPDGTGVRDYIHVVDLARGHVAALNRLFAQEGGFTVNLGTGHGYSVLEAVKAFEKASGRPVPYQIVPRRPGDIASCYASPVLAEELLGWRAEKGMEEMCRDHWRWQSGNPEGFGG
ncbi:UDP-glucose 4-epimerase GalE [Noviherbaspirillum pedocola]|uniref:UDP-glucose 4-epimerase n=1 Tax=Noviherbaspirillum pedocola TaxID=2801341 RepID=A0A934W4W6_9BURK|nr:UDP-glucose 4-epimerase GalE [Noviherbaspirillum pedocola]MBK4734307.1 UDP-glucose 4-epimerase GalE [Noviherbaspirillum pedocola]